LAARARGGIVVRTDVITIGSTGGTMRTRTAILPALALGGAALVAVLTRPAAGTAAESPADELGMRVGAATLQSAGQLTFGPDGTLFVADSRGATLWALDVADTRTIKVDAAHHVIRDLDAKVAAALGTTRDRVRFHDMARHPKTGALYFSVSRLEDGADAYDYAGARPAIVRASSSDAVDVIDLSGIRHASAPVPAAPAATDTTPWGQPKWRLAVTDLAFVDGQLWVAGLSNEQFASALRRVPFPFTGESKPSLNTVEIYHTSHDRWETASPITAFLPVTIGGTPTILAGYGCSPIATFRQADFATAKHLKGRTVAELGGGSRPVDMLRYTKEGKEYILVANSDRTLMRIDPEEIARAPEITTPVKQAFQPAGVGYLPVASSGVIAIDDLNDTHVAVLRRDTESGAIEVVAYGKEWL
jgi:hypothetical protein